MEPENFDDNPQLSKTVKRKDRSLIYMGSGLGILILVMGYFTFFVDDAGSLLSKKSTVISPVNEKLADKSVLNENEGMSDEDVRASLTKFIEAFYTDQRNGYFDPPSYFASITDTYYNFHNLTYDRLKEIHSKRLEDMQQLVQNWVVSSLEFERKDNQLLVTFWTDMKYFKPSSRTEETADVKQELIINKEGKIISLREVEIKNLFSNYVNVEADSAGEETGFIEPVVAPTQVVTNEVTPPTTDNGDSKLYDLGSVTGAPEFPGGQKALAKYIGSNLKYPAKAREDKITGKVYVAFVVEKNGTLTDIKIIRGIGGGCDEEALRVLKLSPPWKAGTTGGHVVRTSYTLPITFQTADY